MGVGPMNRVFQLLCILVMLRLLVTMSATANVPSALWNEPFHRLLNTLAVTLQEWINVSMTVGVVLVPMALVVVLLWQQRHTW